MEDTEGYQTGKKLDLWKLDSNLISFRIVPFDPKSVSEIGDWGLQIEDGN